MQTQYKIQNKIKIKEGIQYNATHTEKQLEYKSLHWLKINERIEYQLLSLTYKALTTAQPTYLHSLISVQPFVLLAPHLLSPFLDHLHLLL